MQCTWWSLFSYELQFSLKSVTSLVKKQNSQTTTLSSFMLSMECQMLNKNKQTRLGPVIQRKAPENKSILSFQHSLFVPWHPSISNYHPSQDCKKFQGETEIGGLYWVNIWFSIEQIHHCTLNVRWRGMIFNVTNQGTLSQRSASFPPVSAVKGIKSARCVCACICLLVSALTDVQPPRNMRGNSHL